MRPALAQRRFGDEKQLVISAESLFGLSSQSVGHHVPNGETIDTSNRLGFLYSTSSGGAGGTQGMPPAGPKVGFHYFVIPSLSIGGTIGFESRGCTRTDKRNNSSLTTDNADETSFVLLPKVGYALMFNDIIGFWFRGGQDLPGRAVRRGETPFHRATGFCRWTHSSW